MDEYPKLRTPILLAALGLLALCIAWKGANIPDWLRYWLMATGGVLLIWGGLMALDFVAAEWSVRMREIEEAKALPAVLVANALRGLTAQQVEVVTRYGVPEYIGIMGETQVHWRLRTPGGDIPFDFVAAFMELSKSTSPYLWPIRKHDALKDWPDSENLCTRLTDFVIQRGWAERNSGPYPARLLVPLAEVADLLGIELDN